MNQQMKMIDGTFTSQSEKSSSTVDATNESIVDRTIHQILPFLPKVTPSTTASTTTSTSTTASIQVVISPQTEFLFRVNGTSILAQTTTLLRLSSSTYATATTIFHRFYHRCSLKEYDVWSVSMSCVFLACKIGEEVRRMSEIILVFVHVYRRMRLALDYDYDCNSYNENVDDNNKKPNKEFKTASCSILEKNDKLTQEERQNILRYIRPLPRAGPVYKEWEEELMTMEHVILRELGFSLYWIPESHPHVFLLYFMKVLELVGDDDNTQNENSTEKQNDDCSNREKGQHKIEGKNEKANNDNDKQKDIAQVAWNYCNDSCRLDLCVRYRPELIACAAIYLSCLDMNEILPCNPRPWWYIFIGPNHDEDLSIVCNALLALEDLNCVTGFYDAMKKYVVSLVDGGSFNDPGSYIWNALD